MPTSSESPAWLDGDKIDEVLFCEELRTEHPMICIHEVFFTVDGKVTDEGWIKNAIFEKLKPYGWENAPYARFFCPDHAGRSSLCQAHPGQPKDADYLAGSLLEAHGQKIS